MKYFLLLIIFPATCLAQKQTYTLGQILPLDSTSGDVTYKGVIEVPNATASELYSRAKTYYLKSFKNANSVIQADVKDVQVSGKGVLLLSTSRKSGLFSQPEQFPVTIEIRVKDGRYRYEFSQFAIRTRYPAMNDMPLMPVFQKAYGKTFSEKQADQLRVWNEGVEAEIANLKKYMSSKSDPNDF
jgi:hypothetical protein